MEVELPIQKRTGKSLKSIEPNGEELPTTFAKTASCNCREDHGDGRPEDIGQGCGAFGRLEVGESTAPDRGIVRVDGKEFLATLADLEWERRAERLESEELATVRTTGEKWTATVGSITGIFSVVALIKGPEDIAKLRGFWEAFVIILVLLAILLAVLAIVLGALAAYGMPRRWRPLGGPLRRAQAREATMARYSLAGSIATAVLAVLTLGAGIGFTWGKTPDKAPKLDTASLRLTDATLDAFRGPIEVHRTVPNRQPDKHLRLVRYVNHSLKAGDPEGHWWARWDQAQGFKTLAEIRDRLALPKWMVPSQRDLRLQVSIPEGTPVTYVVGAVAPQCKKNGDRPPCSQRYAGGATQYYFPNPDLPDNWITERACNAERNEERPSNWVLCDR